MSEWGGGTGEEVREVRKNEGQMTLSLVGHHSPFHSGKMQSHWRGE